MGVIEINKMIQSIRSRNNKYHGMDIRESLIYYKCNHAVGPRPVWDISSNKVTCKNCLKYNKTKEMPIYGGY